ncbi:MAG: TonB-dependent receptor domain-containing protein, partial [bacterium]
YHGAYYVDDQEQSLEAHNIDAALIARGLTGTGIVPTENLNRFTALRNVNANLGGFIKKDKLWWFGGFSYTQTVRNLPTILDASATTNFPTGTAKFTYNVTPNNKITAYGTLTDKLFKNYTAGTGTAFVTSDALTDEKYPIGVFSFGYESLLGANAVLTVHAGRWWDYANYDGKGQNQRYSDTGLNRIYGTVATTVSAHHRPQANGSLAYFKTGWGGSHSFKFGGEVQQETQLASNSVFNNTYLFLNNNVPTFVDLYLSPSSTTATGRDIGAYANDSWRLSSRFTINLGLRYDRYSHFVPAQVGPQGHQFPEISGPLFNDWAPRLGFVYALDKDGKTLVKASYGVYWDNPGSALAILFDPNPASNVTRYNWVDPNPTYNAQGLPIYEGPQQLGSIVSVSGARANFQPAVSADPNLRNL